MPPSSRQHRNKAGRKVPRNSGYNNQVGKSHTNVTYLHSGGPSKTFVFEERFRGSRPESVTSDGDISEMSGIDGEGDASITQFVSWAEFCSTSTFGSAKPPKKKAITGKKPTGSKAKGKTVTKSPVKSKEESKSATSAPKKFAGGASPVEGSAAGSPKAAGKPTPAGIRKTASKSKAENPNATKVPKSAAKDMSKRSLVGNAKTDIKRKGDNARRDAKAEQVTKKDLTTEIGKDVELQGEGAVSQSKLQAVASKGKPKVVEVKKVDDGGSTNFLGTAKDEILASGAPPARKSSKPGLDVPTSNPPVTKKTPDLSSTLTPEETKKTLAKPKDAAGPTLNKIPDLGKAKELIKAKELSRAPEDKSKSLQKVTVLSRTSGNGGSVEAQKDLAASQRPETAKQLSAPTLKSALKPTAPKVIPNVPPLKKPGIEVGKNAQDVKAEVQQFPDVGTSNLKRFETKTPTGVKEVSSPSRKLAIIVISIMPVLQRCRS